MNLNFCTNPIHQTLLLTCILLFFNSKILHPGVCFADYFSFFPKFSNFQIRGNGLIGTFILCFVLKTNQLSLSCLHGGAPRKTQFLTKIGRHSNAIYGGPTRASNFYLNRMCQIDGRDGTENLTTTCL